MDELTNSPRKGWSWDYFGDWDGWSSRGRKVSTPVGADCQHCSEPIAKGDKGIVRKAGPGHLECDVRANIGDPPPRYVGKEEVFYLPATTYRELARRSLAWFLAVGADRARSERDGDDRPDGMRTIEQV